MATAKKLPSGNYRIRIYDYQDANGNQHFKSFTAPTKKQAELLAAEYAMSKNKVTTADISVEKAIDIYINVKRAPN